MGRKRKKRKSWPPPLPLPIVGVKRGESPPPRGSCATPLDVIQGRELTRAILDDAQVRPTLTCSLSRLYKRGEISLLFWRHSNGSSRWSVVRGVSVRRGHQDPLVSPHYGEQALESNLVLATEEALQNDDALRPKEQQHGQDHLSVEQVHVKPLPSFRSRDHTIRTRQSTPRMYPTVTFIPLSLSL